MAFRVRSWRPGPAAVLCASEADIGRPVLFGLNHVVSWLSVSRGGNIMTKIITALMTGIIAIALFAASGGSVSGSSFAHTCLASDSIAVDIEEQLVRILTDTSTAQARVRSYFGMALAAPDSVYVLGTSDPRCVPAIGALDSINDTTIANHAAYVFRFDKGYAVADSMLSESGSLQVVVLDSIYGYKGAGLMYVGTVDSVE